MYVVSKKWCSVAENTIRKWFARFTSGNFNVGDRETFRQAQLKIIHIIQHGTSQRYSTYLILELESIWNDDRR